MIELAIIAVISWVIGIIEQGGYAGIFILMVLEGSFLPVPSEIILTFSGYLVSQGKFSLLLVAVMGALGNVAGTLITYAAGRYLGLPFLYRYGKYILITRGDIDKAHMLFEKHGISIIFVSRLMPGARGYIPIGAGIARMKIIPFVCTVLVGSFLYSLALTYIGMILGEHWETVGPYLEKSASVLFAVGAAGLVWWIWRRIQAIRKESYEQNIHRSELENESKNTDRSPRAF